ncbi:hypothetical protein EYF80_063090 [Liparis tanakae]|uniref:Uncharacterized protein n=1 Tax=Liparis tanakae TaxID=230148 RepID=A0A4Z2EE52_9TELE|nr:hypothetical protein EYF80_063090 [Liparis tanakae]
MKAKVTGEGEGDGGQVRRMKAKVTGEGEGDGGQVRRMKVEVTGEGEGDGGQGLQSNTRVLLSFLQGITQTSEWH